MGGGVGWCGGVGNESCVMGGERGWCGWYNDERMGMMECTQYTCVVLQPCTSHTYIHHHDHHHHPHRLQVLFFMRFLGDIIGRLMPRNRALIVTSPLAIMALGCLMISTVPLYFAYIKAPAMYRSDTGIIAYIVLLWLLCGYVNTTCNITAPKLVKPTLKTGAAGLMAIVFQVSHFCGLCVAVGVSYAFFGGLGGGGH